MQTIKLSLEEETPFRRRTRYVWDKFIGKHYSKELLEKANLIYDGSIVRSPVACVGFPEEPIKRPGVVVIALRNPKPTDQEFPRRTAILLNLVA